MNLIVEKTRKNDVFEIRVTSHTSNDRWVRPSIDPLSHNQSARCRVTAGQ